MDILDITANILPKMHGSIQYRCNQYKIKHTDTKNKILKVYLDGGEQLLLPDFCNLVSADFFSLSFEKKIDVKNFQEFLKQNEVNGKYGRCG